MSTFISRQRSGLLFRDHVKTHLQGNSTTQIPQKTPAELSMTFYIYKVRGTWCFFKMKNDEKRRQKQQETFQIIS
jgi:hypothetical protein